MVLPEVFCSIVERYSELTMPVDTDCSRPNGLPRLMTQSPT